LDDIEIIGHRGYAAHAPENTLASIDAALTSGAHAVEFDVRVARCGTAVVFHDETIERTTDGDGAVAEKTIDQLQALDAGAWYDPLFTGERVPTLIEALDLVAERAEHIYPEIKGIRGSADIDGMLGLVRERAMMDRTTFISIDWSVLERVRSGNSEIRIGFIVVSADLFEDALALAAQDSFAILDLNQEIVLNDPSVVRRAKDEGIKVVTWTVNEPDDATRLRAAGVTGFTTDRVEKLLTWAARESA
jgi:glycerophosphoryl diester phosphodiesterase